MAAVLAAGPGACLSHLAAAFVHSLIERARDPIDVTTPTWRKPRPRITLHTRTLEPQEVTLRHGIPTTTAERTLLDLATVLPPSKLRRIVHQAEVQRTTTHAKLTSFLASQAGSPGAPDLRRLLDHGPAPTRSELEDRLLELLHDFPPHETNARIEGYEVDVLFREQRLIVEADGTQFHATPLARRADADKQAQLEAAGYRVLRVTWDEVTRRPEQTRTRIRRALA
jgi:very-short-patch-repair endonuclease